MLSKRTTSIIGAFAAIIIMAILVGLGYAKLKSEEPKSGSYSEEVPAGVEDPWGKSVISMILRYPAFRNILGAEIGLTDGQKDQFAILVKEENNAERIYLHGNQYSFEQRQWATEFLKIRGDERIRQFLTPMQYARFRDWVIEGWRLSVNQSAKYHNLPLKENIPITFHQMNFLQVQLKLSEKEAEKVRQLIYKAKQEILLLREDFEEIVWNHSISMEKIEKIGNETAQKVFLKAQKLETDLLKNLPLRKRKLYESL